MKIKELTGLMNDHGTRPRIKVFKPCDRESVALCFEGRPDKAGKDISDMKINSFTVLGPGFIEIFAEDSANEK